jgi:glycosyltransferase involved in cell wall biosynthesis/ubiquinone/menaquinone biosynthesis C-methylase UbiE
MMTKGNNPTPVLVGHPFAPIGRGEDIRCSWRAFQAAGLVLPLRDIYSLEGRSDQAFEQELGRHLVRRLSPSINIFHINGDEVGQALDHIGRDLPSEAYNIIYPQWELSIYPREWAKQLDRFDEIWAPSKFVFESISKAVSKPVFHMPLATDVRLTSFLGRRYFDLPESAYLFLFYFDFRSWVDRKNPFAALEAFDKVCAARPGEDIRLVIKLNRPAGPSPWEADFPRFMRAIEQSKHADSVIIIDKILSDNEIKNLVRCCDCFLSLHRSEGYGKGLAEAMFLGKPVIATGYSGNLDFVNEANSCLVRYSLIDVEEGQYPYAKRQVWAEPEIDHVVYYMLKLLGNRDYGRKLGEIASRHIRTYFSYRAIGLRYRNRLEEILQKTGVSANDSTGAAFEIFGTADMVSIKNFRGLSDREWLDILIASTADPVVRGLKLPSFPDRDLQARFVGSSNADALWEAYHFYDLFKKVSKAAGNALTTSSKFLDFGCGWGRFLRFVWKDVDEANIYGVDIDPEIIEMCRSSGIAGNLSQIHPLGVLPVPNSSLDAVIAYSVFTHLPEHVHIHWMQEFKRVTRPGAVVALTLEPRRFLEFVIGLKGTTCESAWHLGLQRFAGLAESLLAKFDSGELVYLPTGGGNYRSAEIYGDAACPLSFVEKRWSPEFRVLKYIDDPSKFWQSVVVLQRRREEEKRWFYRGCPKTQFFKKFSDFLRTKVSKKASKKVFSDSLLKNSGYCSTCAQEVTFVARDAWLRDHYCCSNCGSIPRERALMLTIETYFPNWRNLIIHESSPVNRGASRRLSQECSQYIPSQFFPKQKPGSSIGSVRCENLEALTFANESVDLHVTQDVIEHVFHPSKVFSEIARTLKRGGAHIFTVPIVNKHKPSKLRARLGDDGRIFHLEPPVYHSNPISVEGSLVTVDWGFDICQHIFESSGLFTHLVYIDDLSKGIRAEYIEVLITVKPDKSDTKNALP